MSKLCTKAALVTVFETPIVYGWRVKIYSTHSQIRNEVFTMSKKKILEAIIVATSVLLSSSKHKD